MKDPVYCFTLTFTQNDKSKISSLVFLENIHSFSGYSNFLLCTDGSSIQFTGWTYMVDEKSPYTKHCAIIINFNHFGTSWLHVQKILMCSLMPHTQVDVPPCTLRHASEHLWSNSGRECLHSSAKIFVGGMVTRSHPSLDTTTQRIARCRIVRTRW
jgi:hypothetical protein